MRHATKVRVTGATAGSGARQLELGGLLIPAARQRRHRPVLRLAAGARLRGPDKYAVLEHRRRQAQIRARRLLDQAECADTGVV